MDARTAREQEDRIPADARAVLRIDLDALRANWRKLDEASGNAECAGVIKANAYGLGIEEICRALTEEGCYRARPNTFRVSISGPRFPACSRSGSGPPTAEIAAGACPQPFTSIPA